MHDDTLIRSPLLAGIFYPGDGAQLNSKIEQMIARFPPPDSLTCAIVAPHGSFQYSGRIAARAWGALRGARPSLIVIAGSAHLPYEEGVFLSESTRFDIPGASVRVDADLQAHLRQAVPSIRQDDLPHLEEHSIEMQLPFAAHLFPDIPVLPFIISGRSRTTNETAVNVMRELKLCHGSDAVMVISSDMAVSETPEACDTLSREFISNLAEKSRGALRSDTGLQHSFCAETAIRSFMTANPEARAELLEYSNSSLFREHADELVVGYAAIRFVK